MVTGRAVWLLHAEYYLHPCKVCNEVLPDKADKASNLVDSFSFSETCRIILFSTPEYE